MKRLSVVAGLLLLAACPFEFSLPWEQEPPDEQEDCTVDGCSDDAYCDTESGYCKTSVDFDDAGLEACVRDTMQKPEGAIELWETRTLVRLECPDKEIAALDGLEHFTGLRVLSLWENAIDDLGPLRTLTDLEELQLGLNQIRDLAPLTGLTRLKKLGLEINHIADIAPLAGLTTLEWLNLDSNEIQDVSPLSALGNLSWLTAERNPAADWSVLNGLIARGCEVYKRRPSTPGTLNAAVRRELAQEPWRPDFSTGRLTYQELPTGELRLVVQTAAGPRPLMREYAGQLFTEDGRVVYRLFDQKREVGERTGTSVRLCHGRYAAACQLAIGVKGPTELVDGGRGDEPVYSANLTLRAADGRLGAFQQKGNGEACKVLESVVLASPNQYDAGSCVFMANTGAMEILINQHRPLDQITYLGDSDLSERFLMNAVDHVPQRVLPYVITDLVNTYNNLGGSLLNRDYPFAIGYVKDGTSGVQPAAASDPGAYASCKVNWFDELPDGWQGDLTATPTGARTLIFVDPDLDEYSIWNVGIMYDDVIERVKYELRTKHAPVIAVYNHYRYWHANIIIGYDDNQRAGDCPMVRDSLDYFETEDPGAYQKITARMEAQGGCRAAGIFYVRDSIYDGDDDEEMYEYGLGYSDRYSERVITHSYDWLKYLGNHAYTVHRR